MYCALLASALGVAGSVEAPRAAYTEVSDARDGFEPLLSSGEASLEASVEYLADGDASPKILAVLMLIGFLCLSVVLTKWYNLLTKKAVERSQAALETVMGRSYTAVMVEPDSSEAESEPEKEPEKDAHVAVVIGQPEDPGYDPPPHIAGVRVLFASPLVCQHPGMGVQALEELDVHGEQELICRAAEEVGLGKRLAFRPEVATAESLRSWLTRATGSELLHIVSHGKEGQLVLEDGHGTAHMVDTESLHKLLCAARPRQHGPLHLVTLSACSSYEVGRKFILSGTASRVLCTKSGRKVSEQVAQTFMKAFYHSLFSGHPVSQAFALGGAAVQTAPGLAGRAGADGCFVLLPEDANHEVVLFASPSATAWPSVRNTLRAITDRMFSDSDGNSSDSSEGCGEEQAPLLLRDGPEMLEKLERAERVDRKTPLSQAEKKRHQQRRRARAEEGAVAMVPSAAEDFMGRGLEAWSVLQHLSRRRVVVIDGEEGVGKTAVAEAVARFVVARGQTEVCFVPVEPSAPRHTWVSLLTCALRAARARRYSNSKKDRLVQFASRVISAGIACESNNTGDVQSALPSLLRELSRTSRPVIFVLDGCDHLTWSPDFQRGILAILRTNPKVQFLLTSAQPMLECLGSWKVVHSTVQPLAPHVGANLFLRRARRALRWAELLSAPTTEVPNLNAPVIVRDSSRAQVLGMVANHPLLRQLGGNPRKLVQAAARVTPSLADLRELMLQPELTQLMD